MIICLHLVVNFLYCTSRSPAGKSSKFRCMKIYFYDCFLSLHHTHQYTTILTTSCLYYYSKIPLEAFRRPGPTRIPKPKGCSLQKGMNGTVSGKTNASAGGEAPVHNNNPHLANRRLWHHQAPPPLSSRWRLAPRKLEIVRLDWLGLARDSPSVCFSCK